jgi:hypothetical protein
MLDQVEHGADLGADLLRLAEDVRIVELHRPHPRQAPQHTGGFFAELGQTQRQLAVAVLA